MEWGGRSFSTPSEFAQWLEDRHLSYGMWSKNHPTAAAQLEGREEFDLEGPGPARAAIPVDPATASTVTPPSDSSRSGSRSLLMASLAALAASLLVLALLPALYVRRAGLPGGLAEHQLELAGAGMALAIALAAAYVL